MSVDQVRNTMDRYFKVMDNHDDFSTFFTADVSWLMVDSGERVDGPDAVRDYILELHSRMVTQEQLHGLVVTEGHAYLEGSSVNAEGRDPGLSYCLVYDVDGNRISSMRCYGTIAALMIPVAPPADRGTASG